MAARVRCSRVSRALQVLGSTSNLVNACACIRSGIRAYGRSLSSKDVFCCIHTLHSSRMQVLPCSRVCVQFTDLLTR